MESKDTGDQSHGRAPVQSRVPVLTFLLTLDRGPGHLHFARMEEAGCPLWPGHRSGVRFELRAGAKPALLTAVWAVPGGQPAGGPRPHTLIPSPRPWRFLDHISLSEKPEGGVSIRSSGTFPSPAISFSQTHADLAVPEGSRGLPRPHPASRPSPHSFTE